MERSTEKASLYRHLEQKSTLEILNDINTEDHKVALAVKEAIPQIDAFVKVLYEKMKEGGRLFYIGAGTSGRLGIVDASECPPTFGVPHEMVTGIIAGGDKAIRKAVENAEDKLDQAWLDLKEYSIDPQDVVVGITASGTTPYVLGGLRMCRDQHITTACITNNINASLKDYCEYPIILDTGPEYITGSTRMKAGTSQKLTLNMITTTVMIKLGRVLDNKMVDMQLSNEKLVDRGTRMIMEKFGNLSYEQARSTLLQYGNVRTAIQSLNSNADE